VLVCVSLTALASTAVADGKKKKSPPPAPAPPTAVPVPAYTPPCSEQLSKFLGAHLNAIVAPFDGTGFDQPQAITALKDSFAAEMAQAMPAKKPIFQAAIAVCEAMAHADTERQDVLASMVGSTTVHGVTDLGNIRRDHPGWNESDREVREQKDRNQKAAQGDAFLTASRKTQWATRSAQLRQGIEQLYAREVAIENQIGIGADLVADSPDFSISGEGFAIAQLANGAPAFSNKPFTWMKLPPELSGRRYTQVAMGRYPRIVVRAKRVSTVEVITATDGGGVTLAGWAQAGAPFCLDDAPRYTGISRLQKKLAAGEVLTLPQGNWVGVQLLLPADAKETLAPAAPEPPKSPSGN